MSASCARATGTRSAITRAAAAGAGRAVVDGLDRAAERAHGVEHRLRRARELGDAADREPERGGVILRALTVGQRRGRRAAGRRRAPAPLATEKVAGCWIGLGTLACSGAARTGAGRERLVGRLQVGLDARRVIGRARLRDARRPRSPRRRRGRRASAGTRRRGRRRRRRRRRAAGGAAAGAAESERTRSRSSAGGAISPTRQLVEQRADAALAAVRAGLAAQQRLEAVGCDRIRRAHGIPPLLPGARARGRVASCRPWA